MTEQQIQVHQIAESAVEIAVLKQVRGAVKDEIGGSEDSEPPAQRPRGLVERTPIGPETPCLRQDVVVDVDHRLALTVAERGKLVHPPAVVTLVIGVELDGFVTVSKERGLDFGEPLFRHHDVHVGGEPSIGGRELGEDVGRALEKDDGNVDVPESASDAIHLEAHHARVVGGESELGTNLVPCLGRDSVEKAESFHLHAQSSEEPGVSRPTEELVPSGGIESFEVPRTRECREKELGRRIEVPVPHQESARFEIASSARDRSS
jgi:hypothetical protein